MRWDLTLPLTLNLTLTLSIHIDPPKRFAPDGKAYTENEFIVFFGIKQGNDEWHSAQYEDNVPVDMEFGSKNSQRATFSTHSTQHTAHIARSTHITQHIALTQYRAHTAHST